MTKKIDVITKIVNVNSMDKIKIWWKNTPLTKKLLYIVAILLFIIMLIK